MWTNRCFNGLEYGISELIVMEVAQ
jgi:hypothetical protein